MPREDFGQEAPNYRGFGPVGPAIDYYWNKLFHAELERRWEAKRKSNPAYPPLAEIFGSILGRSWYWFERLSVLPNLTDGLQAKSAIMDRWTGLRRAFSPPLADEAEMLQGGMPLILLISDFMRVLWDTQNSFVNNQSVTLLYATTQGYFRDHEMRYLLEHHPCMMEVGPGSGYFMFVFRRLGGDIIGLDDNSYCASERGRMRWTEEMLDSGRLIVASHREIPRYKDAKRNTLLMCWPEPMAAYPAEALELFARAGGEFFVLKLGPYIGGRVRSLIGTHGGTKGDPLQNTLRFLDVLARDWVEIEDSARPSYLPKALMHNLWIFRRR